MRPLEGRVVLVTRPADQAGELVELLEERGATAIPAPAIEIVPTASKALERALSELAAGGFEWLVYTSRAGVAALCARMSIGEARAGIAAVGDGTADALRAWGREPDLVPRTFTTEALGRAMPRGSGRVLLARADIAPVGLEDALRAKGWTPVRVDAYRTRMPRYLPPKARAALRQGLVEAITFTSASTVRGFVRAVGVVRGNPKVVCIGPVTSRAARDVGLRVAAVARPHTIEGLVAALERVFTPRARRKVRT